MKQTYLFKLFRYSKLAALLAILFIILYSIVFIKKMDMILFPYNSMYSIDFYQAPKTNSYAIIVNGSAIKYSQYAYWKKDLLETSLTNHANYLQQGNQVFLHTYLQEKFSNQQINNFLVKHLTAPIPCSNEWVIWYLRQTETNVTDHSNIALKRYSWYVSKDKVKLTDSVIIYQFQKGK